MFERAPQKTGYRYLKTLIFINKNNCALQTLFIPLQPNLHNTIVT